MSNFFTVDELTKRGFVRIPDSPIMGMERWSTGRPGKPDCRLRLSRRNDGYYFSAIGLGAGCRWLIQTIGELDSKLNEAHEAQQRAQQ